MPLEVQVGGDVSGFANALVKAQALAAVASKQIEKKFEDAAENIALNFATKLGKGLGKIALPVAVGVAGFLAMKKAVEAVTESLEKQLEVVREIIEKSEKADIGAGFFQQFVTLAENARVKVEVLERAIQHFGEAMRPELDPKFTVFDQFDQTSKKIEEAKLALFDFNELFEQAQTFTGLELFRDAKTQEQRVIAMLTAIKELQDVGLNLQAFNLSDKFFGKEFTDNIRRGNVDVGELLEKLKEAPRFSEDLVNRTKEVDVALKAAHNTLERELTPTFGGILAVSNDIKSAWASVILTLAEGVRILNEWYAVARAIGTVIPQFGFLAQLPAASRPGTLGAQAGVGDIGTNVPAAAVPTPRRRPQDAPEAETAKATAAHHDAIQRLIISMERENELTKAQIENFGKSNVEREQAIALAKLDAAQKTAGTTATDAQTEAVKREAIARGKLLDALEKQRQAVQLQVFAGNLLVDAIDKAMEKGAKLADIAANIADAFRKAAIQAAIMGTGPLAGLFGTAGVGGATGGILGALTNSLIPKAIGGPVSAGNPFLVGEKGPELFVPKTSGTILANGSGMGGVTIAMSNDFRGVDPQSVNRIEAKLNEMQRTLPSQVANIVPDLRRRSVRGF